MKKLFDSIKYIKMYDILSFFIFILLLLPSFVIKIINKIKKRKLLLIIENGYTARDNGFHFFKYVRTKHPNDYCFYVIDKKSESYNIVKKYGNIIQFRSLKHWLYYLSADYNISNQKYGNPNTPLFYFIHVILGLYRNRVFLQHGITKDDSPWLYYKNTKFKYFICGAKKEYEYIKEKFGYPEENVIYTGFPRFDNLYDNKINHKQILIMPTWRNWLGRETNSFGDKINFQDTDYFKYLDKLITNKKLIDYIEKNDFEILFYPHMNMQKYLSSFSINSPNIKLLSMDYDIQKALKESFILITDYSSVYMDFAYMGKPVIYYQFDYDIYRKKQLQQGYFNYEKDGFGPICYDDNQLFKELIKIINNGLNKKYRIRMEEFFEIKDKNNSKRIYEYIKK